MTSRERVIAALEGRRPDRIPRFHGGFSQKFIDDWRQATGLPEEADIRKYYGIDLCGILSDQGGPFTRLESLKREGERVWGTDSWGRTIDYPLVFDTIMKEKGDLDRLDFEPPDLPGRQRKLEEAAGREEKTFATVTGVKGLFMSCQCLRGEVEFLMDMASDEPFCRALIARLESFLTELGEVVLDRLHCWDTAICVVDDFGNRSGPMFSPDTFERLFLEPYRRMFSRWKERGVRHIMLHYDLMSVRSLPIIDLFREAGLTCVQGLYPTEELNLRSFRERYGKTMSVIGGMNNELTLPFGTREEIERQAAEAVEFGRDGCLVVGPHSIEETVTRQAYEWFMGVLDREV